VARIHGLACGYPDANDAARLEGDPIHKILVGRDLASLPALSRCENGAGPQALCRMGMELARSVIEHHGKRLGGHVDVTRKLVETRSKGRLASRLPATVMNFCFLPQVNLVHFHVAQRGLLAGLRPTLQIKQIEGHHGVRRKPKLPRHAPRRRTLAGLAYRILEALAEGCLARQLRHLLWLHAAARAAQQPIQLDHHCSQILEAGKIVHIPLVDLGNGAHQLAATRADQLLVSAFAPHPQPQTLALLIDLGPV